MTKGEYLIKRIDSATLNAISSFNKNDLNMLAFWLNAKEGFTKRMETMTLEELSEEVE